MPLTGSSHGFHCHDPVWQVQVQGPSHTWPVIFGQAPAVSPPVWCSGYKMWWLLPPHYRGKLACSGGWPIAPVESKLIQGLVMSCSIIGCRALARTAPESDTTDDSIASQLALIARHRTNCAAHSPGRCFETTGFHTRATRSASLASLAARAGVVHQYSQTALSLRTRTVVPC